MPEVLYTGLECSLSAVTFAQERNRNVVYGDIADGIIDQETADILLCAQALQCMDAVPSIEKMERLIAPGGIFCIVSSFPVDNAPAHHYSGFDSIDDILGMIAMSNFEEVFTGKWLESFGYKGEDFIILRRKDEPWK